MAKTDLKIKSTSPQGASITSTITYINPAATNEQLATLGAMVNTLTDNVYSYSQKVQTTNVDGEDSLPIPTLEVWNEEKTQVITEANKDVSGGLIFYLKYNGDGQIFINAPAINSYVKQTSQPDENSFYEYIFYIAANTAAGTDITFTIMATETDNFQAKEITFTIHVTA